MVPSGFLTWVAVGCVLWALDLMPVLTVWSGVVFSLPLMAFHGNAINREASGDCLETPEKIKVVVGMLGVYVIFSWHFAFWRLDESLWLHIPVCVTFVFLLRTAKGLLLPQEAQDAREALQYSRLDTSPTESDEEAPWLLVTMHAARVLRVSVTNMAGDALATVVVDEDAELDSVHAELAGQIAAPGATMLLPDGRMVADVAGGTKLAPLLLGGRGAPFYPSLEPEATCTEAATSGSAQDEAL